MILSYHCKPHPEATDMGHTFYIDFEEGESFEDFQAWFDGMKFENTVKFYSTFEVAKHSVTVSVHRMVVVAKSDRDAMTIRLHF